MVGGGIAPSQFHFVNVVSEEGPEPGGWKVAQVAILLGRLSSLAPASAVCEVEVQVPQINYQGPVSDAVAQSRAAAAANTAARIVLRERLSLTAVLCMRFRTEMQRILGQAEMIPGARVTAFQTPGVPRTSFP